VGIMSVVESVNRRMDDEPDPTWDEAVAAFQAATPVELVRGPRRIAVVYRYANGTFTATSPDIAGFEISGPSLDQTRRLVQQDLIGFLDPAVEVIERYPTPEPQIATAAGCSRFVLDSQPGIVVTSSGAGRAFVSPGRSSTRRVRA
jgi:hypothetical protein